ncbi:MAG: twin-arginine translocase TatA/TatE family subunit [Mucilaginibacter sp.]|nr:twin-arginine translocase TatA/TatE family subunit [Mucilaginibacter sp.]
MFSSVLLFLNIGGPEMILIVFVALLLFGGEKLPQIARGLGKGIRDFKDASEGVKREITNQINNYEEKSPEEPVVSNPPAGEALHELPPASEEHTVSAQYEVEDHNNDVPNPIAEIQGVPNTIPYSENHGTVSENLSEDHHPEASNSETKTEPVKTTHE